MLHHGLIQFVPAPLDSVLTNSKYFLNTRHVYFSAGCSVSHAVSQSSRINIKLNGATVLYSIKGARVEFFKLFDRNHQPFACRPYSLV